MKLMGSPAADEGVVTAEVALRILRLMHEQLKSCQGLRLGTESPLWVGSRRQSRMAKLKYETHTMNC